MVSVSYGENQTQLIMRPDQSLSWRGNQYLLLALGIWLLCIALFFAYAGLWLVLPFLGLEVLALGAALYYVSRKLARQEVLEINHQHVRLSSGRYQPEHSRVFSRRELVVRITQPSHPWSCPVITLCGESYEQLRLGEFLNRDDCQKVIRLLKEAGLRLRQSPEVVNVSF